VIRAVEGGVELIQIPWGLAPSRPKTPVIINMRREDRTFSRGRCLIPASAYYEFTGSKSPKTRWEVTKVGEEWFCFAGIVGRGRTREREDVEAFSLLTIEPGPDAASYHDRQPAIVERCDWVGWLDMSEAAGGLLRPAPAGSLQARESPRSII
jgi:putative SOS response-associated peptidase YedK